MLMIEGEEGSYVKNGMKILGKGAGYAKVRG